MVHPKSRIKHPQQSSTNSPSSSPLPSVFSLTLPCAYAFFPLQFDDRVFVERHTCRVVSTVLQPLQSLNQRLQDIVARSGAKVVQVSKYSLDEREEG